MTPFKIWLSAARPKTWGASIAPVLLGAALAYRNGSFEIITSIIILITALLIQIGTNYCNDYCDFKKGADKERVGPVRATQAGLVSPKQMKLATLFVFSLALLLGIYLVSIGGIPILLIGILSLIFGTLYTAGPYPLAYIGLGELFVLVFFGPVAVGGTYLLNTGHFNPQTITLGLIPGFLSVGILVVNNLRDYHTDLKAEKRTLIARFGEGFGRFEYTLSLLLATALVPLHLNSIGGDETTIIFLLMFLISITLILSLYRKAGVQLVPFLALTNLLLLGSSLAITYSIAN